MKVPETRALAFRLRWWFNFIMIAHYHRVKNALRLLTHNPRLFGLKIQAKARRILDRRPKSGYRTINGVLFDIDLDYDKNIARMYYDDYETGTVCAMRKFLGPGDVFIDVGANIGYLSAIALGLVGQAGAVHSFEPMPGHFAKLEKLASDNPAYNFFPNQVALGEEAGRAEIAVTNLPNIGWNTMVPDFMEATAVKETVEVEVKRLDAYLADRGLKSVRMIKIDIEGYEFPVLRGLCNYLDNGERPVIFCEIAPAAYPLLGYSTAQLARHMSRYGYTAYSETTLKKMDLALLRDTTDVLFLP